MASNNNIIPPVPRGRFHSSFFPYIHVIQLLAVEVEHLLLAFFPLLLVRIAGEHLLVVG